MTELIKDQFDVWQGTESGNESSGEKDQMVLNLFDNGAGNWRNKSICVTGKPGRGLETKMKSGACQVA